MGKVIQIYGNPAVDTPQTRLQTQLANMLFATAEYCRTAIELEDRDAVRLAQDVIMKIRMYEESRHAASPL